MQGRGVDCSFSAKLYVIISHNVNFVELVRTCLSEKKKNCRLSYAPPSTAQLDLNRLPLEQTMLSTVMPTP